MRLFRASYTIIAGNSGSTDAAVEYGAEFRAVNWPAQQLITSQTHAFATTHSSISGHNNDVTLTTTNYLILITRPTWEGGVPQIEIELIISSSNDTMHVHSSLVEIEHIFDMNHTAFAARYKHGGSDDFDFV